MVDANAGRNTNELPKSKVIDNESKLKWILIHNDAHKKAPITGL